VSVGGALARAAFGAVLRAAREMRDQGTFSFTREAASYGELTDIFSRRS
jgi:2-methylisocitrate lyase-like PEP mutase family enzyme